MLTKHIIFDYDKVINMSCNGTKTSLISFSSLSYQVLFYDTWIKWNTWEWSALSKDMSET